MTTLRRNEPSGVGFTLGTRNALPEFLLHRGRWLIRLFVVFGWLLVCPAGCQNETGSTAETRDASRIRVVATVGMVADVVKAVGGDQIHLVQLMGPGVDPHLYKATRDDVQEIMSADVVFTCGLMLEGRLQDSLSKLGDSQRVLAVTSKLPPELLLQPSESAGHPDPHVWMDVGAWANCLDVIVHGLATRLPAQESLFAERAAAYREELQSLHQYGLSAISSIPEAQRVLVTSHDAFHYFGRAYGLEVIGVQGVSTESEAGLRRINELVDLLVERRISAVFVETSVPRKNIEALIDGAASRGHHVRIGGELFSDAMGPEGTWEGTYIGMLDHNITVVTRALGGSAPDRGFAGKLNLPEFAE